MKTITITAAMRLLGEAQDAVNERDYRTATAIQAELTDRVLSTIGSRNHTVDDLQQLACIALSVDDLEPIKR